MDRKIYKSTSDFTVLGELSSIRMNNYMNSFKDTFNNTDKMYRIKKMETNSYFTIHL